MAQVPACFRLLTLGSLMMVCLVVCVDTISGIEETTQHAAASDRFMRQSDHTALDTQTQLVWMTHDFRNIAGRAPETAAEAHTWASTMNQQHYGGFRDWRVPTLAEYQALYHPTHRKPSYRNNAVGYPEVFADGGSEWYWTQEVAVWGSGHVYDFWIFNYRTGRRSSRYVGHEDRDKRLFNTGGVRLVRP